MWWTKDEIERWSLAAQKQAGYVIDEPFIGHCDEESPLNHFRVNDILKNGKSFTFWISQRLTQNQVKSYPIPTQFVPQDFLFPEEDLKHLE